MQLVNSALDIASPLIQSSYVLSLYHFTPSTYFSQWKILNEQQLPHCNISPPISDWLAFMNVYNFSFLSGSHWIITHFPNMFFFLLVSMWLMYLPHQNSQHCTFHITDIKLEACWMNEWILSDNISKQSLPSYMSKKIICFDHLTFFNSSSLCWSISTYENTWYPIIYCKN